MLFFAPCGQPVMHAPQRTQSAKEIPCGVAANDPGTPSSVAADSSHASCAPEYGFVWRPSIPDAVS